MVDKLPSNARILHVAPEPALERWLRQNAADYVSIDLQSKRVMRRMDLLALDLPDSSFDVVWCSHVLEHVPDDRKALQEIYRVLAPGGIAVIQVPIRGQVTEEDATITTPEGREQAFLQTDHVRLHGLDIMDRLVAAGFEAEVVQVDELPAATIVKCALRYYLTNEIFVARKCL